MQYREDGAFQAMKMVMDIAMNMTMNRAIDIGPDSQGRGGKSYVSLALGFLLSLLILTLVIPLVHADPYIYISYSGKYPPYIDEAKVIENNLFYDVDFFEGQVTDNLDLEIYTEKGRLIEKIYSIPSYYLTVPYDNSIGRIRLLDGDKKIEDVNVKFCNNNRVCEPCIEDRCIGGENYIGCADCQSGGSDGFCDMRSDGRCDPDCEGLDADCEDCWSSEGGCWFDDPEKDYSYCRKDLAGDLCSDDEICIGIHYPIGEIDECCDGVCIPYDAYIGAEDTSKERCSDLGGMICPGEQICPDGEYVISSDSVDCCIGGTCQDRNFRLSAEQEEKPQDLVDLADKAIREEDVVGGKLEKRVKPIFFIIPTIICFIIIMILLITLLKRRPRNPKVDDKSKDVSRAYLLAFLIFISFVFVSYYYYQSSLSPDKITGFAASTDPEASSGSGASAATGKGSGACNPDISNPNFNMLITDQDFTDTSITKEQIKRFLDAEAGNGIKKDIGTDVLASAIDKASKEMGISPIVLLTTLQKEQSFIKRNSIKGDSKDFAAGCGCPDSTGCQEQYRGLENQMKCMVKVLKKWYDNGKSKDFPFEMTTSKCFEVKSNPIVENAATFSLYKYTPHTYDCSYKTKGGGNYLFYKIFLEYYQKVKGGNPSCTNVVCAPIDIKSEPRMTAEQIKKELDDAGSPAKDLAQYIYDKGKEKSIDPAILMALFKRESKYGTEGPSKETHSVKNIGCSGCADKYDAPDGQCYCRYPDWKSGIDGWYKLIEGSDYIGSGILTVEAMANVYEPSNTLNSGQLTKLIRDYISKFTQLPDCSATSSSSAGGMGFTSIDVGNYYINPSFSVEVNYGSDLYARIQARAKELVQACKYSQTKYLDDCIKKETDRFHGEDINFDWVYTAPYDELPLITKGPERLFYELIDKYEQCIDSDDTGCICSFTIEEGALRGFDDNDFPVSITPTGEKTTSFELPFIDSAGEAGTLTKYISANAGYFINSVTLNPQFSSKMTYEVRYKSRGEFDNALLISDGGVVGATGKNKIYLYLIDKDKIAYIDDNDLAKTIPGSTLKFEDKECKLKESRIFNFDVIHKPSGRKVKFALTFPQPPPPKVEALQIIDRPKSERSVVMTWNHTLDGISGFRVYYGTKEFKSPGDAAFQAPFGSGALFEILDDNIYYNLSESGLDKGSMQYELCKTEEKSTCRKAAIPQNDALYKLVSPEPDRYVLFLSGLPQDGEQYNFAVSQITSEGTESEISEIIRASSVDDVSPARINSINLGFDTAARRYSLLFTLTLGGPAYDPDRSPLGENGQAMVDDSFRFVMYGKEISDPSTPPSIDEIISSPPILEREMPASLPAGQDRYSFEPIFRIDKDYMTLAVIRDKSGNPDLTKPENKDLGYITKLKYDTSDPDNANHHFVLESP